MNKCTHAHKHTDKQHSPERRHARDSTQRQSVHQSEAGLGSAARVKLKESERDRERESERERERERKRGFGATKMRRLK